jgi:hypothetical protein
LQDNWEWEMGLTKRFGLHYVDYTSPNLTRLQKASAVWFRGLIRSGRVQDSYAADAGAEAGKAGDAAAGTAAGGDQDRANAGGWRLAKVF